MDMRHLTNLYLEISWKATGYGLSCARIVQKRETSKDRKRLVELSDKFLGALKLGSDLNDESYHGCFLNSLQGCLLAVVIEEEYLKRDDKAGCECAKELRELGVDSLDKLAEILSKAEDRKEFDKYAPHLHKFFYGWHAYAEECCALDSPPVWPPTFGAAIGKVLARQSKEKVEETKPKFINPFELDFEEPID